MSRAEGDNEVLKLSSEERGADRDGKKTGPESGGPGRENQPCHVYIRVARHFTSSSLVSSSPRGAGCQECPSHRASVRVNRYNTCKVFSKTQVFSKRWLSFLQASLPHSQTSFGVKRTGATTPFIPGGPSANAPRLCLYQLSSSRAGQSGRIPAPGLWAPLS